MRNKIFLTILAVVTLSGCTAAQQASLPSASPQATNSPSPTPYQRTGSLLSLLDGTDKQCKWNSKVQDYDINGLIYTSGLNFRAEVKTRVSFLPVTGYAVGNGQTVTAWANLAPDKKVTHAYEEITKLTQASPSSNSTTDPILSQFLTDQTYICEHWTVEPAAFTTPK